MKRRSFLKRGLPVATIPFLLNGFSMKAFGKGSIFEKMLRSSTATDKVLVIIQLAGGNDGLNTVIPLDQYSALSTARANILIPENLVLPLDGTTVTGLHPSMPEIQALFNNKEAMIIQGVSYPNPNFSHFEATDIWMTASDSGESLVSGWAGRYLADEYPGYPTGYPNQNNPDPLAIQIGSTVSTALQGPAASMGIALTNTTYFYQLTTGNFGQVPATPAGHELAFIRETSVETQQYSAAIKQAALNQSNLSTLYPTAGTNPLADQLKIVAQLIGGGLQTKIYMVSLGSFDTHSGQVSATGGNQTGDHANLLSQFSVAVNAFMNDITLMNQQDRVLGMTFSEFGRRIISNGSQGTDHGTAEPVFLFGSNVKGGFVGNNPVIPANAGVNDNLVMQTDFRSVYSSVLANWFCVPVDEVNSVMATPDQASFPLLSLFTTTCTTGISEPSANSATLKNYPNPANGSTVIEFQTTGGSLQIKLYDAVGNEVMTVVEGSYAPGVYQIEVDTRKLASGMYYYTLRQGQQKFTGKMLVM
jgi:uncharacterized protein (DUF1501 family)